MIAADTSILVAYLAGEPGSDVEGVDAALSSAALVLPPVVLTEILCAKGLDRGLRGALLSIPLLAVMNGYWERAGRLRARILRRRLRARLADTLVAQSCIDHGVPLLTRDGDFRHFARHGGLRLA